MDGILNGQGKPLPCKLLFIGPTGAGKSTVINRLQEDFQFSQADVLPYVEQYIERMGEEPVAPDAFQQIYRKFLREAVPAADVVEIANDILEWLLPRITDTFFDNGQGNVVYISAPTDLCWERLQERDRPPDKQVLRNHQQYTVNDVQDIVSGHDILHVQGGRTLQEKYARIHAFIERKSSSQ